MQAGTEGKMNKRARRTALANRPGLMPARGTPTLRADHRRQQAPGLVQVRRAPPGAIPAVLGAFVGAAQAGRNPRSGLRFQ